MTNTNYSTPTRSDHRPSGRLSTLVAGAGMSALLGALVAAEDNRPIVPNSPDRIAAVAGMDRAATNVVVADRCQSCHRMGELFTHPVNVIPSMDVPASLPLISGRMTCLTCHDVGLAVDHTITAVSGGSLLRSAASAAGLCAMCHSARDASQSNLHATMLNQAHLRQPQSGRAMRLTASSAANEELDELSVTCLGCHDGSVAGKVIDHTLASGVGQARPVRRPMAIGATHPIGIDYDKARRTSPGAALRHALELDPSIRLFDGRVGCGTCHSTYSTRPFNLVMSNLRSRLCLSCHDF